MKIENFNLIPGDLYFSDLTIGDWFTYGQGDFPYVKMNEQSMVTFKSDERGSTAYFGGSELVNRIEWYLK